MDDRHDTSLGNLATRRFGAVLAAVIGLALCVFSPAAFAAASDISTVAGNGANAYGGDGGAATSAQMMAPAGVAFGPGGDLYVADFFAHTVRKISPGGTITTIAGTGVAGYSGDGGPGTAAQLNMAADVVADPAGNVYIADFGNHRVRKVAPDGTISVVAGTGTPGYSGDSGPALLAQLDAPAGLDLDSAGNLYVTDFNNGTVRKITPSGFITTLAGSGTTGYGGDGGPATSALLNAPTDVVVDGAGTAYIAELYGNRVRKVTPGGTITTLAGTGVGGNSGNGGPADVAQLNGAAGVDVDSTGNVFIAEFNNADIRKVTPAGTISRVAGTGAAGYAGDGGPALSAQINTPSRVTLSPSGDFYISDWGNHRVRHVEALGTPAAPTFSASAPASPGNSTTPRLKGASTFGTTVRLYTDSSCTSSVAGTGTPAQFASPGLSVTVGPNSTTTFWAKAMDGAGNESGCSTSSFTYVSDSIAPGAPSIGSSPTSPGNDITPTWSFTGEAGATFECKLVRGATVVSDWAACASAKTYDLTAQPDGAYAFSVRAVDAAGNAGPAATASSYALDATPPAAPAIGTSPGSPGNDPTPTWSFTGEAGATFECKLARGATVVSDWAACTDPQAYDLSSEADGGYTFSVRAHDALGNTGPAATSVYALDRTAPAPPVIGTPPTTPGNDATPTWSFSGEAGATFECRVMRGIAVVSDWASCSDPETYDLSAEADGTYSFSVRARDLAGNTGAAAGSTYVLDTDAPAAPAIDSAPASPDDDSTPTWGFSAEAGASFQCKIARGATVVSDWAACTSTKTYDLTSVPDGSYDFSVRAIDTAGNTGPAGLSSYVLDRTAPVAPAFGSQPATPSAGESPFWSFTGETGAAFECLVMRGATVVSDWSACSSPVSVDLSAQPDGLYSFSVRQRDVAGNTGVAASSPYELDRTAPGAPSMDATPPSPRNDETPTWSFSHTEPGVSFECRIARGATVVSDWAACSDPKTYDISAQPDGSYGFSVRAVDAAGNRGPGTGSSYVLDRVAPSAPAIDSAPASLSADDTPAWAFSSEAGATFECRLERGASVVSDWTACASPDSFDLTSVSDGTYDFKVRATDAAGNLGPAATSSYQLDRTAPVAPSIDTSPPSPGSSRNPAWAFSGEAGATFQCKLARGASVISDWAVCSGSRMYDLLLEPDGDYDFSVRAIDAVGNVGAAASSTYRLDTIAPLAPTLASEPVTPGRDTTPTWSFSSEPGATLECRLQRGATMVSDWASCSDPKAYDLSAEPDGDYQFEVRATDAAGNQGAAASSAYRLDTDAPVAPSIDSAPSSPDDDATPAWSFSGEAGAAFECRLTRGATTVSGWASCSDPKSFDLSAEADGTYDFAVRATDAAGNVGPAATSSYDLDRAAPSPPAFDDEPATPGSDDTPTWDFSGESGASFECLVMRGATVVSNWAACTSPETAGLTAQPDGAYSLSVRATDAAGNTGFAATSDYELDRTPPAAPSIDAQPSSPQHDTSPAWSFSGEAGASFECKLARGATLVSDWAACSNPKSYDLSSRPDGTYSFSVRAVDAAGNAGPAASADYELDSSAPAAPSIDAAPQTPGNDATVDWDFSGESGAAFECRLERGATVVDDWASCASTQAYDLSGKPDGDYDFKVRATDAAGNTGPSATSTYSFDTAAPTGPTIDTEPVTPSSDRSPAWSFSATEAGSALECRLERGATVVSDWAGCASPLAYDLGSQPDGTYLFLVRAHDAAGNRSGTASSLYDLDRSVPNAPSIDSAPGALGNDATPAWGFSGQSGMTFQCKIERGGTVVSDWAACTSAHSFDLTSEPDGHYDFSVRAINRAHTPSEPATSSYELDRGAPAAPAIDGSPTSPDHDAHPAWSFSGEPGASFECRLQRGGTVVSDWAACSSPEGFDVSGQPDGDYTFAVRATDDAGNTGAAATSDYRLDTAAPAAPSIDSAPASPASATTPAWGFSGEAGAAFECRLERAGNVVADWAACASPQGYDVAAEPDGAYSFSVRARDAAGNTGAAATSAFELDRAGAVVAITNGPGAVGRDQTPAWGFGSETGATFECKLEREGALVDDWTHCTSPRTYDLSSRLDGAYDFSVRATDATGNLGAPATSRYVLDGVAPAPPSIDPIASPSSDRRPGWHFDGEAGATFECRMQGPAALVSDWVACVSPRTFDLAGLGDGRYSLSVRATDAAGNVGAPGAAGYDLDTTPPDKPRVSVRGPDTAADESPVFEFTGEPDATYECTLTRGGQVTSDRGPCNSPKSFDLTSEPDGTYTLAVRATDVAGNLSASGTGDYTLQRTAPGAGQPDSNAPGVTDPRKPDSEGGPGATPGFGSGSQTPAPDSDGAADAKPKPDAQPAGGDEVGNAISGNLAKRLQDATRPTPQPQGKKHTSAATKAVKTLGKVAGAVVRNADKTVFPTLLILMVVGFFGIQNRIDRNDPKLGLSPVFADPDLEFGPPPVKS